MLSPGRKANISKSELLSHITEWDILEWYFDIHKIPTLINSPLRNDKNPSFGIYTKDGNSIYYKDFATGDKGDLIKLLSQLWHLSYSDATDRIYKELISKANIKVYHTTHTTTKHKYISTSKLECGIREWRDYDLEWWGSYGISLDWLKYADIHPVKHIIFIRDNNKMVFPASKYSYAYVERKNGVQIKIYQPFETIRKWYSNLSDGTISLWNQALSQPSDAICICSSMKDALTLWANYGIPCISPQGEAYGISQTAQNVLKSKFKHIYICYDNDKWGIADGEKLANDTGFINIVLPQFEGGKDIADYRKLFGKQEFINLFKNLFNYGT